VRIAADRNCTGALALQAIDLNGTSLPAKTLALSFDDGPGERTVELSQYLHAQGIASSFFVNGKMLTSGTAVLAQLVADGHLIGNHTQTHVSLTGRATGTLPLSPSAAVQELALTDGLIAPFLSGIFLFRAPYGDFDAQTAADLNASAMRKYVGPINWDIGDHMGPDQAADWDCWRPSTEALVLTPQQCGDLYVQEIDRVGRGVVLLHDPYFVDDDPSKGGTVDMIKYIVPILRTKGYSFVRLDKVPDIAALLPPPVATLDAGAADAARPSEAGIPGTANPDASGPERNKGLDASAHDTDPCAN
jgi:peptidoglycan/xylan/chitin deacetylase (PgdA/CDA1 family)